MHRSDPTQGPRIPIVGLVPPPHMHPDYHPSCTLQKSRIEYDFIIFLLFAGQTLFGSAVECLILYCIQQGSMLLDMELFILN